MSMGNFVESIIANHGIQYKVERLGAVHVEVGAQNELDGKPCFMFLPSSDVKPGDWLENSSGNRYLVIDAEIKYDHKSPAYLQVTYQTASQANRETESKTVFNIQNAYGSIIGNNNHGVLNYMTEIKNLKTKVEQENSPDKSDMKQIISLLEMIVSDKIPPSKGLFSKFSNVMNRHSWLSSAVASAVLSWLQSQI